jgi:hypothetical protein
MTFSHFFCGGEELLNPATNTVESTRQKKKNGAPQKI